MFNYLFFFENRAVYETMLKNIAGQGKRYMKIWHMRIAFWIPMATNTQSQYVILIVVTLQQWLHERASKLRYKYTACLGRP
jgi:hypothetical protein